MKALLYWIKNIKGSIISILLLSFIILLLGVFMAMREGTMKQFDELTTTKDIYTLSEANLSCPIVSVIPASFEKIVSETEGVLFTSPEIRRRVDIMGGMSVPMVGILPDKFLKIKKLDVDEKAWQNFVNNPDGVLIGKHLEKSLIREFGSINNKYNVDIKIEGVFSAPTSLLDSMMILHKKKMEKYFFQKEMDQITIVNMLYEPGRDPEVMRQTIEDKFKDSDVHVIVRPEEYIWERMKQTGSTHDALLIHIFTIVISLFFVFTMLTYLRIKKYRNIEKDFIKDNNIKKVLIFRGIYSCINLLLGFIIGGGAAFLMLFKRTPMGGADIFVPVFLVDFTVLATIFVYCVIIGIIGVILANALIRLMDTLKFNKLFAHASLAIIFILFGLVMNLMIGMANKVVDSFVKMHDEDTLFVVQSETVSHPHSNIPFFVSEASQLARNVKQSNGVKLVTPVIEIAEVMGDTYVDSIGVNLDTFFQICERYKIIEGRKPMPNTNEILAGKKLGTRIHRNLQINDTIKITNREWKIVGFFEAAGSIEEMYLLADIESLKAATGREQVQFVVIKLEDVKKVKETEEDVMKYYEMYQMENPDITNIDTRMEKKFAQKVSHEYEDFYTVDTIALVVVMIALYLMLYCSIQFLVKLEDAAKSVKDRKDAYRRFFFKVLLFCGIYCIVSIALNYLIGQFINLNYAQTTFNLQTDLITVVIMAILSLGTVIVSEIFVLNNTFRKTVKEKK